MLVLTRRPGEAVWMGPDISVRVLGVKGNQVRLGFIAPKEVEVDREEIAKRKGLQRADSGEFPAPEPLHPPRGRRRSNTVDEKR